jgi:hypothetical protein
MSTRPELLNIPESTVDSRNRGLAFQNEFKELRKAFRVDSTAFLKMFGLNETSISPHLVAVYPKHPIEIHAVRIRDIDQRLWPDTNLLLGSTDWTEEPFVFDTYSQRLSHIICRMLIDSARQADQNGDTTLTSYYLNPAEHDVDIFMRASSRANVDYI